jgi:hypothetical protein
MKKNWLNNRHPQMRIAIIGAGPGGLTAAHYLKKRGYQNITVFEKLNRVGGKCLSFEYKGKNYDLGFHEMAAGYTEVIELAKEVGVPTQANNSLLIYDRFRNDFSKVVEASVKAGYSPFSIMIAVFKYAWLLLTKYRNISKTYTGFADTPEELTQPLSTWMRKYKLEPLEIILQYIIKIQGFGRLDENSAAYFVKFQNFKNWISVSLAGMGIINNWPRMFPKGSQQLWETVAKELNVRLNSNILSIKRVLKDDDVVVEINIEGENKTLEFDQVIMACPLDLKNLQFLDISEDEKRLFGKFQYVKFYSTACKVEGLPKGIVGTVPLTSIGGYTGYIKDYEEDMAVYYSLAHENQTGEEIIKRIKEMTDKIPPQNGIKPRILEIYSQTEWTNFFPHVTPAEFGAGYYKSLESLQGQRKTYYTTSLFSMELLSTTVAYTKKLIEQQFPKVK